MSIVLRPAEPRDAEFLGWASVTAARSHLARGWFDVVLGRDDRFLFGFATYLALAAARSWWHWSVFRVAESDDAVVAALCGFGGESYYRESGAAMAEASDRMGIDQREQDALWTRGAFILSATTSEAGAWTIENVATKPGFRRRGIVQELLKNELKIAHDQGYEAAQVSVLIGNTGAERTYEKAGFAFVEEKRAPEFEAALGSPGTRRFRRGTAL